MLFAQQDVLLNGDSTEYCSLAATGERMVFALKHAYRLGVDHAL
jgi:hypothetical protein